MVTRGVASSCFGLSCVPYLLIFLPLLSQLLSLGYGFTSLCDGWPTSAPTSYILCRLDIPVFAFILVLVIIIVVVIQFTLLLLPITVIDCDIVDLIIMSTEQAGAHTARL